MRPAKAGARGWRYESCFKDYGEAMRVVDRIASVLPVHVRQVGRLGSSSLPFTTAQSVRPGMVMYDDHGGYDVVESVEWVALSGAVYDLNIEGTHNFVAGGSGDA